MQEKGTAYTFKVVPYYKSGSTRYAALNHKTAKVTTPLPEPEILELEIPEVVILEGGTNEETTE